jgi:folate-binding protein YgfZ
VAGPQAEEFLQGQLSQDVAALAAGVPRASSAWSLLLQPTGKVDAWLRVNRLAGDEFVLDVDDGFGEAVVERLGRFKLRTKADIDLLVGWDCWSVRGATDTGVADTGSEIVTSNDWPSRSGPLAGTDLLGSSRPGAPLEVPEVGLDALETVRVECGVPRMGAELTEATIPAEAGQWLIDGSVSFSKGCYTGQELVARIDSRGGNVPKHLRGVVVDGATPPVGAAVVVGDADVGVLTSVVHSFGLDGPVALAFVARKVEPPADATVKWNGGEAGARIEALPLV